MEMISTNFVSPLDMKVTAGQVANERNICDMRRRIVNDVFSVELGAKPHGYAFS